MGNKPASFRQKDGLVFYKECKKMAFKNAREIKPFEEKVWLARPSVYKESMEFIELAYKENYMTTAGTNVNEVEREISETVGCKYAVALSAGTAALHMAMKLAGEAIYGKPAVGQGALRNHRVFCSDLTFAATVNPVVYEGGIPVYIDTEYDTWNMDPVALEKAFEMYPEVKVIAI
jgi:dTDP-4-amino-4,6-dideoxygalactose transaminase